MVESGATAGSFLTPEERAFARQEEDLLRQIRLAQMQVELMELQKKITDSMSGNSADQPTPPQQMTDSVIDAPPRDPFTLVSIWGDENGLKADFLVRGRRNTLTNGGSLPDSWRVVRITQNAVDMRRGNESRTLNLGGAPR
jgi:type IV pilus biogenesis protein PilP